MTSTSEIEHFSVPIAPSDFLATYMSHAPPLPGSRVANFAAVPHGHPTDRAERIIEAVEAAGVCPGLRLFIPEIPKRSRLDQNNPPADWEHDLALDIDLVPALAARVAPQARNGSNKPRLDVVEYYKFETAILGIDINTTKCADPWVSSKDPVENMRKSAFQETLLTHARAHFVRQQRTHLYHFAIMGHKARFFRFDRGCCVLSEPFNYIRAPRLLSEFFWRFAHLSDTERGQDPTAQLASRTESWLFEQKVQAFLDGTARRGARPLARAEKTLDRDGRMFPTWRIRVTDDSRRGAPPTTLIVRRPFAGDTFFCGRGTRAYIAYEPARDRLVFFKDQWRKGDGSRIAEFVLLQRLARAGVERVPEVYGGGDVWAEDGERQSTEVRVLDGFGVDAVSLVHHRVVQELLYPLSSAQSAEEFLQVLHDAVCVICDAYDGDAKLLHRDISYDNIMLTEDGRGVLIDWDWAGDVNRPDGGFGIGSRDYLSIGILEDGKKTNDIEDDLQSVFWVLVWAALTQFDARPPAAVEEAMQMYAGNEIEEPSEEEEEQHRFLVADRKRRFLKREFGVGLKTSSKAMDDLIVKLANIWAKFERDLNRDLKGTPPIKFLPSFAKWKAIFAKPLGRGRAAPSKPEHTTFRRSARLGTSAQDVSPPPPAPGQKKRKREDDPPADDTGTLRRSKRIKKVLPP